MHYAQMQKGLSRTGWPLFLVVNSEVVEGLDLSAREGENTCSPKDIFEMRSNQRSPALAGLLRFGSSSLDKLLCFLSGLPLLGRCLCRSRFCSSLQTCDLEKKEQLLSGFIRCATSINSGVKINYQHTTFVTK